MKSKMFVVSAFALAAAVAEAVPSLVPAPREVKWGEGVCANPAVTDRKDASIPKEGYRLEVAASGITVTSSDEAGAFYARQTLRQLAWILPTGRSI